MRLLHPAELDELKELRESAEACWRRMDLALLPRNRGLISSEDREALAVAYRAAEARYRSRCLEHLRTLRPAPEDPLEA